MARDSRPPGFDMTYRPQERRSFGPPPGAWLLPALYFAVSSAMLVVVLTAPMQAPDSVVFRYVVEGDALRVFGARGLAFVFFLGGIAALVRTGMRGVVIHPDGVETRTLVTLGWPKVTNCTWAEIDELVFDGDGIGFRLWNGQRLWLPRVWSASALRAALETVAAARAIPVCSAVPSDRAQGAHPPRVPR